jgi:hypothetical protein
MNEEISWKLVDSFDYPSEEALLPLTMNKSPTLYSQLILLPHPKSMLS